MYVVKFRDKRQEVSNNRNEVRGKRCEKRYKIRRKRKQYKVISMRKEVCGKR